jgi:CubicO group peptidase (beta-lactamase class C family)
MVTKTITTKTLSTALACMLLGLSTAMAATAMAATAMAATAMADDLESELDTLRQANRIAGLYLVTAHDGTLNSLHLGVTDHATTEPLTGNHYVRLGSVSKLFLGLAALRLQEKGDIQLDRPLTEYIGELPFTNQWQATHPVTLAQLIEHSAGLPDMSRPEWAIKRAMTLQEAFSVDPKSRVLQWPPGLHSSYSNSGAGIASYVLEQATRQPFEATIQKEVFDYLGLTTATYFPGDEVQRMLIKGYNTDGITEIPYWHTLYRAFGGINIQVKELPRLLLFFVNGGQLDGNQLFSAEQMERMYHPTTTVAARSGLTYGYGLGLYQYSRSGVSFVGHGGDADGYLAHIGFSPSSKKGYIVVINAFNYKAMRRIRQLVEESLLTREMRQDPPPAFAMSRSEVTDVLGLYTQASYRFESQGALEIFEKEDVLFTQMGSGISRLIPVSSAHFRRQNEPTATIAITQEGELTYFQSDDGNYIKQQLPGSHPDPAP